MGGKSEKELGGYVELYRMVRENMPNSTRVAPAARAALAELAGGARTARFVATGKTWRWTAVSSVEADLVEIVPTPAGGTREIPVIKGGEWVTRAKAAPKRYLGLEVDTVVADAFDRWWPANGYPNRSAAFNALLKSHLQVVAGGAS